MAATVTVRVGERIVTVRELTIREIRDWLAAAPARADHDLVGGIVRASAFEDCGLDDLAQMSDISAEDLEAYAPSDLAELVAAGKALNSHFFRGRATSERIARTLIPVLQQMVSTPSAAASPSSDMPASGAIPGVPT